ncbi:hypothetical protein EYC84_011872 [Monilinia fructicola]|uniref:Uncharacterized protein n=1 Tax=Monilinia fructicola TaxID=38448 RepID=A0A5M9J5E1_MONFR|nr:hypothetical protein EYC84_011872 [Monilinia fructicola]
MSASTEDALTANLLTTIRYQRHLGTRIFISTQEPTINPALIDLCSMTIVHRFSSPEWLRVLRRHVAALDDSGCNSEDDDALIKGDVLGEIVRLRVGEALLFAPEAIINPRVDRREMSSPLSEEGSWEFSKWPTVDDLTSENSDDVVGEGRGKKISDEDVAKEGHKVMKNSSEISVQAFKKLGTGYIKMKVRDRLTNDGGRSVIAA